MSDKFFRDSDGNLIPVKEITKINNNGDTSHVFYKAGDQITSVEIEKTTEEFEKFLESDDKVLR